MPVHIVERMFRRRRLAGCRGDMAAIVHLLCHVICPSFLREKCPPALSRGHAYHTHEKLNSFSGKFREGERVRLLSSLAIPVPQHPVPYLTPQASPFVTSSSQIESIVCDCLVGSTHSRKTRILLAAHSLRERRRPSPVALRCSPFPSRRSWAR